MTHRLLAVVVVSAVAAPPLSAQTAEPLTCLLAPARVSALGTDQRSIVAAVPVERADFVAEGAALIELDRSLAEADRRVAEITVEGLRARMERAGALAQGSLIALDELEQLRTDLALAEAALTRAAEAVARTTIRAPFDGYVAQLRVSEGELTGNDPLLHLIDVATLKAEMSFLDGAFGTLRVGQELRLAVDLVGREVTGRVTVVDPFLDAASNTFSVVAEIANPDLALPAGASCRLVQE